MSVKLHTEGAVMQEILQLEGVRAQRRLCYVCVVPEGRVDEKTEGVCSTRGRAWKCIKDNGLKTWKEGRKEGRKELK